ncbi:MAG: hypothetical protein KAQ93_05460 [Spirochaetales bacterium]|nr:hypothetical protein [Spirochaetales bacterium]
MKKNTTVKFTVCLILISMVLTGCVMNRLSNSYNKIELNPSFNGMPVTIDVVKGAHWSQRMQAGPFIFNILPQIVIWTEDEQGNLIENLYITGADGIGFRNAAKKEKGADFYTECFPVWANRMAKAGRKLPSDDNPFPDTVTSATPSSSFTLQTTLPDSRESIILRTEINQSADMNKFYTKENNGWVGQPSLIYELIIPQLEISGIFKLKLIGHGGLVKDNASIYRDVSKFDTALEQVESIVLRI